MKRRTLNAGIVLGCLLAFLFLVGACGGDDDDNGGTSGTTTTSTSTTAAAVPTTAASMTDTAPADSMMEFPSDAAKAQYDLEPDEGVPQYGGYLQMNAGEDPRSLNFLDNVAAGTGSTLQGVYDRLVRWKFEGGDPVWKEIAPGIAESWSVTDDGLTWTFKIRDDVQFHDGTPLTAADVKTTYDHYVKSSTGEIDFRPPARSYTGPFIESTETPDDYTLILNLGAPASVLLQNLSAAWVNIVSKKDYDTHGPEWFVTNVNGTGPYRWAPDKWERGVSFELERNDNFWEEGLPYLDGKRYTVIPSSSLLRAAFETQAIDVVSAGGVGNVEEIVAKLGDKVRVVDGPGGGPAYALLNTKIPPFDDVRIRQAIYLLLDRDEIAERALQGAPGYVGTWFEPNTFSGNYGTPLEELRQTDPGYALDKTEAIQMATALFAEAGFDPRGYKLTVISRGNSPTGATFLGSQVIAAQLSEIGFDVDFSGQESLAAVEKFKSGEGWNATLYTSALPYPAPESMLNRYLSSNGQRNYSHLVDETVDTLAAQITSARTEEDRRRYITELEDYLSEGKNATFFIYFSGVQFLEQSYVHARRFVSSWYSQYDERTWLDERSPTRQ
ncbi:MAG: ABC transporter substrate-binding protein [Chloroflexota bacterium]|nr:ABC transporter substrate-binding protein [Chloroflexota bacterium]MDE2969071.1 ABC transporter substrate-binding protein [Chloroflexota bacterium]